MSVWGAIELAAWVLSAGIALWMIADVIRVSREYDEEFLTSAIEIDDSLELATEEGVRE
jgi:hypothetical protein